MTQALSANVDGALDWLKRLFCFAEDGWVNLFSVERDGGARSTAWARAVEVDVLRDDLEVMRARGCVYFGAATRRSRLDGGRRGGAADCLAIPALWLDVDYASEVHRLPNLPASDVEAEALILSFQLPPTAVVYTGHGYQPWWFLAEPLPVTEAEPLLTRWGLTWARLASERGVHLDPVWNVDRVMRLPGTFNMKREPVLVKARLIAERIYQPSDFDDHLDPAPTPAERHRAFTGHLAGSRFDERVSAGEVLASRGWTLARAERNGNQHWHHNGSSNDISATVYADDGYTCVWSETVAAQTGCRTGKPMTPWALYTFLVHRGDFIASHADLLTKGFKNLELAPSVAVVKADLPPLRLEQRTLSTIKESDVIWLWEPWIPLGKISSIFGAPGVGKSTVALDIGARLTRGLPMPDGSGGEERGAVILLSAEDDPEDTITRRFRAAGGDLDRVRLLGDFRDPEGGVVPFTLPAHVDELGYQIADIREKLGVSVVLLIIDVLMAYIDDRVDTNADSKVRRALRPLQDMVRASRAAVLVVRHPRKGGGSATEAGGGSIGFTGSFRSEMVTGYHPENDSVRVLAVAKNNLAAKPPALSYQLVPVAEMGNKYARVVWGGQVEVTADQLTDPTLMPKERDAPAVAEACRFIDQVLGGGQEMPSKEFDAEAKAMGISRSSLNRARQMREVEAYQKSIGFAGQRVWMVRLPEPDDNTDSD